MKLTRFLLPVLLLAFGARGVVGVAAEPAGAKVAINYWGKRTGFEALAAARLTDERDFTLALALQSMQAKSGLTDWHSMMAASTLVILPIIALFLVAQRHFIEGIAMTGNKT